MYNSEHKVSFHCPNCNQKLGCGCELVHALNGKMACVHCVADLNKKIKEEDKNTKEPIAKSNKGIRRFIV